MPIAGLLRLTRLDQPLTGVGANRFKQLVSRAGRPIGVHAKHRLTGKVSQMTLDVRPVEQIVRADRFGRLQGERAGKHGEPA